jgi:hypothetical protein
MKQHEFTLIAVLFLALGIAASRARVNRRSEPGRTLSPPSLHHRDLG